MKPKDSCGKEQGSCVIFIFHFLSICPIPVNTVNAMTLLSDSSTGTYTLQTDNRFINCLNYFETGYSDTYCAVHCFDHTIQGWVDCDWIGSPQTDPPYNWTHY